MPMASNILCSIYSCKNVYDALAALPHFFLPSQENAVYPRKHCEEAAITSSLLHDEKHQETPLNATSAIWRKI